MLNLTEMLASYKASVIKLILSGEIKYCWPEDIIEEFNPELEFLNSGCFAAVVQHPLDHTRVLRFTHKAQVDGWQFYRESISGLQGAHWPIIYQHVQDGFCAISEMEKLSPYEGKSDIIDKIKTVIDQKDPQDLSKDVISSANELRALFLDIRKTREVRWDLARRNVMLRGDQIVFTDPFC